MRLIVLPALITLAVTLLRMVGELRQWSPPLFSPRSGAAIVGIVWLVPVFGVYFALTLARDGRAPSRPLRAAGLAVLALLLNSGAVALGLGLRLAITGALSLLAVSSWSAVLIAYRGWPELGRLLLAYAFAARIPVVLVMLAAISGRWGTHYDQPPPNAPELLAMGTLEKWFWIGLVPQLTVWICVTVAGGILFGSLALAVRNRLAGSVQRP